MTAVRSRAVVVLPAVGAGAIALAVAGVLAVHLGPRYDELHTLSHLGDDGPGDLWRSYRAARDTLPPTGYLLAWGWAKVAGTGVLATRAPGVVAWGLTAAALGLLVRRAGPWGAFVAGLVPSATALVYLGAFARPYAPALAAATVGAVCWQRSLDRPVAWSVASAGAFALAAALHYLVAPVALCASVASLLVGRRDGRALAPAIGAAVPLLVSAPLYARAAADQGRLERSVRPVDLVAFWPSALRPALAAFVVAVAIGALAALVGRATRSAGGRVSLLGRELLTFGVLVAVGVPAVAVVTMAVTSGTYVHRYGVGAVIGLAVLAAEGVGRACRGADGGGRWVGPALGALAVAAVALAGRSIATTFVSADAVDRLPVELGLDDPSGATVLVLDEYDAHLLWRAGGDDLDARVVLVGPATVAGAPHLDRPDLRLDELDGDLEAVGDAAQVAALLADAPGWRAVPVAEASYVRPGVDRVLVRYRLDPPS